MRSSYQIQEGGLETEWEIEGGGCGGYECQIHYVIILFFKLRLLDRTEFIV